MPFAEEDKHMPGYIGIILCILFAFAGRNALAEGSAYVVLGENGAQVARYITAEASCPLIRIDGRETRMNVRARPASLPGRSGKPSVFPLLTCEMELPENAVHVTVGNEMLPLKPKLVKRIVVIGDTGCRLKKGDHAYQACNDKRQYPFARIAAEAASWKPDLVLHVGDLLYRENPCPSGHPECQGSPWGYGWDAWNADFFIPGEALLKAAPWVLVRGNHESCSRAGQGWWLMMDPRPLESGRDCNDAADDDMGDYSDPYAVPLGDGAQLIVMDTSSSPEHAVSAASIGWIKFKRMHERLAELVKQASYNMVANHQPILGLSTSEDGRVFPGNQGIQSVFGALDPKFLPAGVNLLLSGHVHAWQQVSFSSPHPTQFIAGFSGTMEDTTPLPDPIDVAPASGAVVEHLSSWFGGFGYMTLERKGAANWEARVWDVNGKLRNTCAIDGSHSVCDQAHIE